MRLVRHRLGQRKEKVKVSRERLTTNLPHEEFNNPRELLIELFDDFTCGPFPPPIKNLLSNFYRPSLGRPPPNKKKGDSSLVNSFNSFVFKRQKVDATKENLFPE